MRVDDFDYELPPELIAQQPLPDRASSRLMVVDPLGQSIVHRTFRDVSEFLQAGDVLVFNNSKVLPARLYGVKEGTGAHVELLLARQIDEFEWDVMAKPAKRLKPGTRISFSPADGEERVREVASADLDLVTSSHAEVVDIADEGLRRVRFHVPTDMETFLEAMGQMPLPPYIREPLHERDRYQTVYAQSAGSVAAPTAGLHFTDELLQTLRDKGVQLEFVTLHVGLGTFLPVKVENIEAHHMHTETYEVPEDVAKRINQAKAEGRRIISVGTTALRTLESAHEDGTLVPGRRDTGIFIYPGYRFRMIDALITNFHLPKSTLIMLVAALMGQAFTHRVYEEAVAERYRFFSFGDAMFITRKADPDGMEVASS